MPPRLRRRRSADRSRRDGGTAAPKRSRIARSDRQAIVAARAAGPRTMIWPRRCNSTAADALGLVSSENSTGQRAAEPAQVLAYSIDMARQAQARAQEVLTERRAGGDE